MNILGSIPFFSAKPRQVLSSSWDERKDILEKDVNLFCWKRDQNALIASFLEKVLDKNPKPIQFHTTLWDLDTTIVKAKQEWSWEDLEPLDLFWEDVAMLVRDFVSLSGEESGTVHLKTIMTNECSKFHMDGYPMRLFTTYYGQGTEWLPESATNRTALGKTNEEIVKDHTKVQRLETCEVGILKGEVPNRKNKTRGIVHRSPEIVSSQGRRVILRIDV